jgi:hypothetical protein
MARFLRWYGANPLHLLTLGACFALAGYAAAQLVPSRPLGVAVWFLAAVIGHDLLLVPLYSLADRPVMAAIRHRAPRLPMVPWINYVRVPAVLSGLLLLVWFPLIFRLPAPFQAATTLSEDPYVWHWLAVTGALFLLSAAAFALRLRAASRAARLAAQPAVVSAAASPVPEHGHIDERESPPGQQQPAAEDADAPGPIRNRPGGQRDGGDGDPVPTDDPGRRPTVHIVHPPADHDDGDRGQGDPGHGDHRPEA